MISSMKTLLQKHVQWMNTILQEAYQRSDDPKQRVEIARAALANLTWLGWLRAVDAFSPMSEDVHVVEPEDGYVLQ
jgi:hypothetical protein